MKTELAKLIYQNGSVTDACTEYLQKVYNELKQVGFFDHESGVDINLNPKDFFGEWQSLSKLSAQKKLVNLLPKMKMIYIK